MKKHGYQGKLLASPGNGTQLAEILLEAAQVVAQHAGCHLYMIGTDPDMPDAVFVNEIWESPEAQAASLKDEAVRALIGKAMPLLAEPPQKGQVLEIWGGHSRPQ